MFKVGINLIISTIIKTTPHNKDIKDNFKKEMNYFLRIWLLINRIILTEKIFEQPFAKCQNFWTLWANFLWISRQLINKKCLMIFKNSKVKMKRLIMLKRFKNIVLFQIYIGSLKNRKVMINMKRKTFWVLNSPIQNLVKLR